MPFSDVINQHKVKEQLAGMVHHNRLSHALLFLGKEGSGALPLALAFAQFMVCTPNPPERGLADPQSPLLFGNEPATPSDPVVRAGSNQQPVTSHQPTVTRNDSCNTCPSCSKARQLIHPDIHFSYPVITKKPGTPPLSTDYITEWREFIKQYPYGNVYDWLQFIGAENKQGNITAQECNDILRKLNLKSFESGYKIVIMWMPEYLGTEGNKLLKIIEEPPPDTLIILVAENENLILPTIISRCQLIKIPSLDLKDIEEALSNKDISGDETIRQVAAICDGNYRMALQLIKDTRNDAEPAEWQSMLRDWLNAILKSGPVAQTKWVEEIARLGRENQKQFIRYFNYLLELAVRTRFMENPGYLRDKEKDFADRLNRILSIEQQQAITEELDKAAYYIERNANGKILFHALTIKINHIIADKIVFLTD